MQRASDLFSDEQRKRVEQAVIDAEATTSAEIVPVVAGASGHYDRPEDIVGLWAALIAVVIFWVTFPRTDIPPGDWSGMPGYLEVLALIVVAVIAFVAGTVIASRVAWLRRLFTSEKQMRQEVSGRARQVFFDKRVHHTGGATGLLIYVSLFEHIAVVLADQEILDKLGQVAVDELCAKLTEDLHTGNLPDAICATIEQARIRLSEALPRAEGDINELHDALVLLD